MTGRRPEDSREDAEIVRRAGGTEGQHRRSVHRVLAGYAAAGSGPFELLTALLSRGVDATRKWPEPWRRILWGQRR